MTNVFHNEQITVQAGDGAHFLTIQSLRSEKCITLRAPCYEVNGRAVGATKWVLREYEHSCTLRNGGCESILRYVLGEEGLVLDVTVRCFPGSPFVRFRYGLTGEGQAILTKSAGKDAIAYTGFSAGGLNQLTEIQISQFDSIVHSFLPCFEPLCAAQIERGMNFPGPILVIQGDRFTGLLAYEHGAEYPDSFLEFHAHHDGDGVSAGIHARKGNYYDGQTIDAGRMLQSPWFHFVETTL